MAFENAPAAKSLDQDAVTSMDEELLPANFCLAGGNQPWRRAMTGTVIAHSLMFTLVALLLALTWLPG